MKIPEEDKLFRLINVYRTLHILCNDVNTLQNEHFVNLLIIVCVSGIILEYEQGGIMKNKSIDLLDLKPE